MVVDSNLFNISVCIHGDEHDTQEFDRGKDDMKIQVEVFVDLVDSQVPEVYLLAVLADKKVGSV